MDGQDKMYLINKLFNNETIRTVWDKEHEKYFISIVDLVGALSESESPRNYWKVLKHRLKKEIAVKINRSLRTVKNYMSVMQDKGLIERKNGKRDGEWIVKAD